MTRILLQAQLHVHTARCHDVRYTSSASTVGCEYRFTPLSLIYFHCISHGRGASNGLVTRGGAKTWLPAARKVNACVAKEATFTIDMALPVTNTRAFVTSMAASVIKAVALATDIALLVTNTRALVTDLATPVAKAAALVARGDVVATREEAFSQKLVTHNSRPIAPQIQLLTMKIKML